MTKTGIVLDPEKTTKRPSPGKQKGNHLAVESGRQNPDTLDRWCERGTAFGRRGGRAQGKKKTKEGSPDTQAKTQQRATSRQKGGALKDE